MARQIIVEIVGDDRKLTGTLTEATGKVEGFGGRLKNVGKGLAIGAGVAGFNLLTTAVGTAVSKLDDMHNAFLEDEASQARLQNVLKNTQKNWKEATAAVEAYAQAQLKMGFDDAATRDSIEQLAGVTKDYAEAIRLSGLAADIARAKNIDLATATDAVTRAANGSARGLIALGINVRGAAGPTQILARAFQNVRGAQEAYARTGAGRVAAANVKMQETMEKLGKVIDVVSQVVIPVMVDGLAEIVDIAGDVIASVTGIANAVGGFLTSAFNAASDAGSRLIGVLQGIAGLNPSAIAAAAGGFNQAGSVPSAFRNGGVTVNRGVNIGVPVHHSGGVVAGPLGSDQLIMAQAGETVTPRGQTSTQVININIASFIGSDRDIDRFSDRLAFRLRSTSLS